MSKHPSTARVEHQDMGANGPAMSARPALFDSLEGRARGTINTVRVEVVRYKDATLYDRLHQRAQINDRQHEAAHRLAGMWTAAGLNPRVSATLRLIGEDEMPFDEVLASSRADPDAPTAKDRYRAFMRAMPPAYAIRLDAMLLDEHPGVQWLATLQSALDFVADRLVGKKSVDD